MERITMGEEVVEQRRYVLLVRDGKVIRKRVKSSNQPAYQEIYSDDPNQADS
jgi:hypothetical protein